MQIYIPANKHFDWYGVKLELAYERDQNFCWYISLLVLQFQGCARAIE